MNMRDEVMTDGNGMRMVLGWQGGMYTYLDYTYYNVDVTSVALLIFGFLSQK